MDKLCRLMCPDLSQLINPLCLAREGECLNGQFSLKEFQRLEALLSDDLGELVYNLNFSVDAKGICCIGGELKATVNVICQRCLEPMQIEVNHTVSLGIVRDMAEATRLAPEYEPLVLAEETLSLIELVENELILALPFSTTHAAGNCPGSDILAQINHNQIQSPFAILARLKPHKYIK